MNYPRFVSVICIVAATALLAACSSSNSPSAGPTASVPTASAAGGAASSPGPSAAVTRIEVKLTDALRMEPASMNVPAGVPVTFVVTNAGAIEHEFYIGDEDEQAAHEQEMQTMGGMTHDEPEGIAVKPGETKELTFTFASAGETLAGCHVQGHYAAGMKATIKVGA